MQIDEIEDGVRVAVTLSNDEIKKLNAELAGMSYTKYPTLHQLVDGITEYSDVALDY